MADQLVRLRIMGTQAAVEAVAARLHELLTVAEESADSGNRRGPGVRRYLDVLIDPEQPRRARGASKVGHP